MTQKLERATREIALALPQDDADAASATAGLLHYDIPKILSRMDRSVAKCSSMIDGLLKYSRTGREEYAMVTLDMDREVARVLELFAARIEEKNVEELFELIYQGIMDLKS